MVLTELVAAARSRPDAVKGVDADKAVRPSDPGVTMVTPPALIDPLAGSASRTTGGTVKLPSLVLAVQVNVAPTAVVVPDKSTKLDPEIETYPAGSPPVQVRVTPLARLTVVMLA